MLNIFRIIIAEVGKCRILLKPSFGKNYERCRVEWTRLDKRYTSDERNDAELYFLHPHQLLHHHRHPHPPSGGSVAAADGDRASGAAGRPGERVWGADEVGAGAGAAGQRPPEQLVDLSAISLLTAPSRALVVRHHERRHRSEVRLR